MARVIPSGHRSAMDPLKLSAPLGGALVFLGLARSIPLLHGSQGCSAFAKALLTRHFREPIPLQTTAVTELSAVLGPATNLHAALDTVTEKLSPDVIGVLTTGLVEASGEDVDGAMVAYRGRSAAAGSPVSRPLVVPVSTPDFVGGLSDGWSAALTALVTAVASSPTLPGLTGAAAGASGRAAGASGRAPRATAPPTPRGSAGADRAGADRVGADRVGADRVGADRALPVLAGVSLTAADLDEVAWLVEGFGLRPLLVPDLSGSLDGHLAEGWSPLTTGGTSLADLALLPEAAVAHAVGATAGSAAAALASLTGADTVVRAHLAGLDAVDAFVTDLIQLSGSLPGDQIRRWRARFTDTLLDTHFVLGGARVAIAAEPEHLAGVATLLAGVGAEVVAAVTPTPHAVLAEVPCEEVVVGDLEDLRQRVAEAGADLVVGSSHVGRVAAGLGAAHVPCGIPVHDRFGTALHGTVGYRGGTQFLIDAANRLLDHRAQQPRLRSAAGVTAAPATAPSSD
jgi:nitrogenase molybdenum-iron protein NifN